MINARATENSDIDQKDVAFKNNAPFISCIRKINSTVTDNAKDKLIVHEQTMQKILIQSCRCLICKDIVKNIL